MPRKAEAAGIDFQKCRATTAQAIFGISGEGLRKWFNAGAPKNKTGTISMKNLIAWRIDRDVSKLKDTGGVKQEEELKKLELQNKKLEAEINKIEEKFIPVDRYSNLISKQTLELRDYLLNSYKINLPIMAAKLGLDKEGQKALRVEMKEFVEGALNAFVDEDNGKNAKV